MKNRNKIEIGLIVLILMLLIGLFLPYASSKGEYRESLESSPSDYAYEQANLTNKDFINISIFEFAIAYYTDFTNSNDLDTKGTAGIHLTCIGAIIISSILMLLFIFLRKRVGVIIFDVLMLIGSLIFSLDKTSTDVMFTEYYNLSISYYLYFIVGILIFICSIILIIKNKKQKNIIKD